MIQRMTEGFLTSTCTIEREEETPIDAYGDRSHEWVTVAEDVACRVIMAGIRTGGAIVERASQEQMRDEVRLIVSRNTALDVDYRVTLADGTVYDVVRIETLLTDEAFHSAILNRRL